MGRILLILVIIAAVLGVGYYFTQNSAKIKISNDPVVAAIQKREHIVLGTDATYPPMENANAKGEFEGFDIDLAREIAKDLGVELEVKNIAFDKLIEVLNEGGVDMIISSMTIKSDRAQVVDFSNPYLNAGQSIIVVSTNDEINEKEDLKGKKIAVQDETTSEEEALKLTAVGNVTIYKSEYTQAVNFLKEGKIDAIVMDYPAAANLVHNNMGTKIVGEPFTSEFYGVAVKRGSENFIDVINKSIAKAKSSGLARTWEEKWLKPE